MKKIIALVMAMILTFSVMSISVYAEETSVTVVTVNGIEFIFEADTTEEFRNKIIADYFNTDDDSTSYGLTCTLFGHDIETSSITTITHNARTTSPKCLQELYDVETCTRCDYASRTLLNSKYIVCC